MVFEFFTGFGEILLALSGGEDIDIVGLRNSVIAQFLDNYRCLLLVDQA